MTYEQAREEIAKWAYRLAQSAYRDTNVYYRHSWSEIPEYAPMKEKLEGIRDEYRKEADRILSFLFTPEQIEEWKKGGYPTVVCKDQSLPKFSFSEEPPNMRFGYQTAQKDMAGFRRVKGVK